MKHPDLNASGSSKVLTGFDDAFGLIEANGRIGREVGNNAARRAAMFGKPEGVLGISLAGEATDTEHASGDDLLGICLFCCLGLSADDAWAEGFKVTVAGRRRVHADPHREG